MIVPRPTRARAARSRHVLETEAHASDSGFFAEDVSGKRGGRYRVNNPNTRRREPDGRRPTAQPFAICVVPRHDEGARKHRQEKSEELRRSAPGRPRSLARATENRSTRHSKTPRIRTKNVRLENWVIVSGGPRLEHSGEELRRVKETEMNGPHMPVNGRGAEQDCGQRDAGARCPEPVGRGPAPFSSPRVSFSRPAISWRRRDRFAGFPHPPASAVGNDCQREPLVAGKTPARGWTQQATQARRFNAVWTKNAAAGRSIDRPGFPDQQRLNPPPNRRLSSRAADPTRRKRKIRSCPQVWAPKTLSPVQCETEDRADQRTAAARKRENLISRRHKPASAPQPDQKQPPASTKLLAVTLGRRVWFWV